ncbi:type II toxin-antitoxin system PemK/MazF family toxin [Streptomyces sp. NPDC047097]|uniref:type II toxin-antitoxin system PemK/MazF family toxin n=1 Tax=Streptomyces sp. NPDC047097 TaxID=3155260 RepID=UPI0033C6589B
MDTSWWPALGAVVVLAAVAAVVDGLGRGGKRSDRRPGGRTRPPGRPPGRSPRTRERRPEKAPTKARKAPGRSPEVGEVWWAQVPYEDGPGSKDRPCLVLAVRDGEALVAKITTRHRDGRPGVIALRPGAVGDTRGRPSFLETEELREVPLGSFRRRVGPVDPLVWDRVRHLSA